MSLYFIHKEFPWQNCIFILAIDKLQSKIRKLPTTTLQKPKITTLLKFEGIRGRAFECMRLRSGAESGHNSFSFSCGSIFLYNS